MSNLHKSCERENEAKRKRGKALLWTVGKRQKKNGRKKSSDGIMCKIYQVKSILFFFVNFFALFT